MMASAIDLSLVSPDLAVNAIWSVGDDTLGSDHLLIELRLDEKVDLPDNNIKDRIPKFNYKLANWELFQSHLLLFNIDDITNENIDVFYSNITNAILMASEHAIPKCKSIKIGKYSGNVWWTKNCENAVSLKKEDYKKWIKNKSDENFCNMKKSKINCNRIIAEAKKNYWIEFCKHEITESKDISKAWKKVKDMKNGLRLQSYPVKLLNNIFPSNLEKAEAFVNLFSANSLSTSLSETERERRESEEKKEEYKEPFSDSFHYVNAPFYYDEFKEALQSFANNNTAVGIDGISYKMLLHLPDKWKLLLHSFYQRCWSDGILPKVWKESVVVPILKQGKCRSAVDSYRPIALTSNCAKVMEKIVLQRLQHYCDTHNVIPVNQAGFRKGRSTTDHLVKITSQIKKQFSRRKSTLATFFDVKKAYDSVWHSRLLHKIKNIGINGMMYKYIQNFLSDRSICTRVGRTYSSFKSINMGIPQGSLISPLLFTILIHDLPKSLSKHTQLVQYADDIAIWVNTKIRKNTDKRVVNYVQKLYQTELNNLTSYMAENGLELSGEKTCLMLFNNGENPKHMPKLELNGIELKYKQSVKFLGVCFTPKLNWKVHIEALITKAQQRLNLIKIISMQPWGQDTKTLLHLAASLVRAKLTYGQEVYFSAPNYLLKRLQSIDSRSIKIAIGVPVHSNTLKTYKEVGFLSLSEQRKLAAAKYMVRSISVDNSVKDELLLDSVTDYPKRARNITFLQPLKNYVSDILSECNVDIELVSPLPVSPILPQWEHSNANFEIEYTKNNKTDNIHLLVNEVREHMEEKYANYIKVYTDGSVLDSSECGAGFIIPDLKIQRSYYLGRGFSIFTSELYAIFMALDYINNLPFNSCNIVLCVDSQSVLHALQKWSCKTRRDLIYEIKYLIHCVINKGIKLDFVWVPSHVGIFWNEMCDLTAKQGALNSVFSYKVNDIRLSYHEIKSIFEKNIYSKYLDSNNNIISFSRNISSLIYRLRLNCWKTKFCKNIKCSCLEDISVHHILFECLELSNLFLEKGIDRKSYDNNIRNLLYADEHTLFLVAKILLGSDLAKLL